MPFSCSSFLYIRFFLLSSYLCDFWVHLFLLSAHLSCILYWFIFGPLFFSFVLYLSSFFSFSFFEAKKQLNLEVSYYCLIMILLFVFLCSKIRFRRVTVASTTLHKFPCFLYMLLPFSISLSIYSSIFSLFLSFNNPFCLDFLFPFSWIIMKYFFFTFVYFTRYFFLLIFPSFLLSCA